MTSHSTAPMHGPYELVDNVDYGSHQQALAWLAENYSGPLNVMTGYISTVGSASFEMWMGLVRLRVLRWEVGQSWIVEGPQR